MVFPKECSEKVNNDDGLFEKFQKAINAHEDTTYIHIHGRKQCSTYQLTNILRVYSIYI